MNNDLPLHEIRKIPHKIGADIKSVFEVFFERDSCSWIPWQKTVKPFEVPKEATYSEMVVPTLDSIRVKGVFNRLLKNGQHVLLVGPTGTGKSIMINEELRTTYNNDDYTYIALAFSAQTTAGQTQAIIDGKLMKLRKGHYVPDNNRTGILFVDDLNMPKIEDPSINATQPAIEILR